MDLEQERQVFESQKAEWLKQHRDQFVLVKGSRLIGVYPDAQSAYADGLTRFGLQPFLVKQVLEEEPVAYVPLVSMTAPRARL